MKKSKLVLFLMTILLSFVPILAEENEMRELDIEKSYTEHISPYGYHTIGGQAVFDMGTRSPVTGSKRYAMVSCTAEDWDGVPQNNARCQVHLYSSGSLLQGNVIQGNINYTINKTSYEYGAYYNIDITIHSSLYGSMPRKTVRVKFN